MSKKIDMKTILTKISGVFKRDAYIINGIYCIGGTDSEESILSHIVLKLSRDVTELISKEFPDTEYLYIKSIKDAKENLDSNMLTKIFDNEKNELNIRVHNVIDLAMKTNTWDTFNLSDEEIEFVFTDCGILELFGTDEIPPISIAKRMFPLLTEKKLDTLRYHIYVPECKDELLSMITYMPTDYFDIYNLIQFICL